jgi:hypothetical protein
MLYALNTRLDFTVDVVSDAFKGKVALLNDRDAMLSSFRLLCTDTE